MFRLVLKWFMIAATLLLLARFLPGIEISNWQAAFWAALIIGAVNVLIGTVVKFVTFPITILTLGLFIFIVNAFLFWLASVIAPGFEVYGFLAALLGSLILSMVNLFFDRVLMPA